MSEIISVAMETIADIMKMDREKQSQPINTAEVFSACEYCMVNKHL